MSNTKNQRGGRFSVAEQKEILEMAGRGASPEDIAKHFKRNPETIKKFLRGHVVRPTVVKASSPGEAVERLNIRQELKDSEAWRRLKSEFNEQELVFFEEQYVGLMAQFRGNILRSEEIQLMQSVKYEILMSRNLEARRRAMDDIARLEKMQEDFLAQFGGDPKQMDDGQKAFALNLETQLTTSRSAEQARTNEHVKLQACYDAIMKNLKAHRDQRVKEVESGKTSILGLLKQFQHQDVQQKEGRQMELMRLAADKEYNRLGQLTNYEDGGVDRPILSPETVELGEENEDAGTT